MALFRKTIFQPIAYFLSAIFTYLLCSIVLSRIITPCVANLPQKTAIETTESVLYFLACAAYPFITLLMFFVFYQFSPEDRPQMTNLTDFYF